MNSLPRFEINIQRNQAKVDRKDGWKEAILQWEMNKFIFRKHKGLLTFGLEVKFENSNSF